MFYYYRRKSSEEMFNVDLERGTRLRQIKGGDDIRVKNSDPSNDLTIDHHVGTSAWEERCVYKPTESSVNR